MNMNVDLNSTAAMERLVEAMYAGNSVIGNNDLMSSFEKSIVTSDINTVFHTLFDGKSVGMRNFGDYLYVFDINEFNDYVFISKEKI